MNLKSVSDVEQLTTASASTELILHPLIKI